MGLINKLFGRNELKIQTYDDFWNWFNGHEQTFYKVIKTGNNIETNFFQKLSPKLEELKDGFFFVAGMFDNNTAELILTPDGIVENIVFVEELIAAAPSIPHWKFTALKPALDVEDVGINMAGYQFNSKNLSFYANEHENYPDKVDIVIVHNEYNEEDQDIISNGTYIFVDNFLGELNSVTTIDNLRIISKDEAEKELIPIERLKSYLIWREKEFLEKYSGTRNQTENDTYSSMEATLDSGLPLIAIINTSLLNWDGKASHPWILKVTIHFDGNINGMPDNQTYELMNNFEDEITSELKDIDGYLNVGRQTADSERIIYFACNEFRKSSKFLHYMTQKYADKLDVNYTIYKDKYWQSLERFRPNNEF